uniref:hypothetical protein n=1 Tax=uncultured Flavobacterium sp. TaxID=165435 RepID=UPI0025D0739D
MKYKVLFSSLANTKLVSVTTYLKDEWSLKVKQNFVALFRDKVLQVSQYPESCIKSEQHFN